MIEQTNQPPPSLLLAVQARKRRNSRLLAHIITTTPAFTQHALLFFLLLHFQLLPPNQHQRAEREFASRLDTVARLYGVAAAMRLKTEKEILSRIQRPPGLPSSHVALETVLGKDETIEFEDILNGKQQTSLRRRLVCGSGGGCKMMMMLVVVVVMV